MGNQLPSTQRRHASRTPSPVSSAQARIGFDEFELAYRWGLSVKTLRRWRQEQQGPIFCKFGRRVSYLLEEIEAFERRAARYSTFARVYQ